MFSKSFNTKPFKNPLALLAGKFVAAVFIAAMIFSAANPLLSATFPVKYRQQGFFYKPCSDTNTSTLMQYYDNFILTRGDEKYRDTLKAAGVASPIIQYVRFDAIEDPGSCTVNPGLNQVAYKAGDFCTISQNNPDWFLLDTYGKRMYNGDMVMMDPGSAGWRSFFLTRAKEMQQNYGWPGMFLDNVEGSLVKRSQYKQMPAKYTTDSSYQTAIKGMLSYLYTNYFKPNARPLFANLITMRDTTTWLAYMNYLDGGMCEGWGVGWGNTNYRSTTDWLDHLSRVEKTQALGKHVIAISQGDKTNTLRQQYAYASFLLVDNGRASFRYANPSYYRNGWTYSNYLLDLGTPVAAKYVSGSEYCRDYSAGKVCVDPTAHTSKIIKY